MTLDIGYVNSNRSQVCRKCGKTILPRAQSVKYTKKFRGAHSLTDTWYVCLDCEKGVKTDAGSN